MYEAGQEGLALPQPASLGRVLLYRAEMTFQFGSSVYIITGRQTDRIFRLQFVLHFMT